MLVGEASASNLKPAQIFCMLASACTPTQMLNAGGASRRPPASALRRPLANVISIPNIINPYLFVIYICPPNHSYLFIICIYPENSNLYHNRVQQTRIITHTIKEA